jgi:cytidylate kinase
VLISREGKFMIPSGNTVVIEGRDVLLVLANMADLSIFQQTVA